MAIQKFLDLQGFLTLNQEPCVGQAPGLGLGVDPYAARLDEPVAEVIFPGVLLDLAVSFGLNVKAEDLRHHFLQSRPPCWVSR
ncbi:hypothetical protein D3C80_1864420 [compost metagenome]